MTRPELGLHKNNPMIRKYKKTQSGRPGVRYTEEFKRHLIEEYLDGTADKRSLLAKYGVRYKGAFQDWMQELGYVDLRRVSAGATPVISHTMKSSKKKEEDPEALRRRIKDLERQLEDEKLRSEAYARLIALAEREQGVSIRKKDNTK
jgi:transposase